MVWSHDTDLEVDRATDFDGSDITADEKAKDWDITGSSIIGVRLTYDMPTLFSFSGELGVARATVRDEDVDLDLESRGLDEDLYLALGARIERDLAAKENLSWSAGVRFSTFSSDVREDVDTSHDYDETIVTIDGRVG